jgi:hypothetical protein
MIKTFRGLLQDLQVDRIRLSTKKGKVGYRIINFQIIQEKPGQQDTKTTVTVSKVDFTPQNKIDLTDGNVLAIGYFAAHSDTRYYPMQNPIIFDQEIFNHDIFIGSNDFETTGRAMNYYLVLETMTLSDNATAVSTLRDIRLNPQVGG